MGKLPKNAEIGEKVTKTVSVKGKKRKITWERVKPHGKNKKLTWKIISNKKV